MSDEEKNNDPKQLVGNLVASLSSLKESNPKALYGGVGGFILLLLILMMGGGNDSPVVSGPKANNLVIGQTYTLKEANTYDPNSVVKLVGTPGNLKAYDDTDEEDREGCKNVRQGAKVTIKQFFDYAGTRNAFSKVKIIDGKCKDYEGWTLSINVK